MTSALEPDRFRLPMPTPATLVVPQHLVVAEHSHLNARFDAMAWPLAPLIAKPSSTLKTIYWHTIPDRLLEELKLATWTMINGRLRPSYLKQRGVRGRGRLAPMTTLAVTDRWKHLALWLEAQGIDTLTACDSQVLHEYGIHLRDTAASREQVLKALGYCTRLWAVDELSARPTGIHRPPWDEYGVDDYLPALSAPGGENRREPLAAAMMGPLLVWAIRVVEDFADDILAARDECARLRRAAGTGRSSAEARAALEAYFGPLIAAGAPLPTIRVMGAVQLNRGYVTGTLQISADQFTRYARRRGLSTLAAGRPGPCPLDLPVSGRLAGRPWRRALDHTDVPSLLRHLGTAAFIVCSYLTGMRPEEVLGMRAGCCPDPLPDADGRTGRHLIRSTEYKNAVDEHGDHQDAGREREVPWVAITPVVNAIRILERMVDPGRLLFDHTAHDTHFQRQRRGTGSIKPITMCRRIEDFVAWANTEAAAHGLDQEVIAPDPHGRIGTARFRRTLAWHIARQPGGLIALAIQYGHLRTALNLDVTEGYGSRSRGGIHDLIDVETVLATAETAAGLRESFAAGHGISGPAARRALLAAAAGPRFEGREVTARFAKRYLARDGAILYDNPHALLLCLYRHDTALCARSSSAPTSTLERCVPGCGNAARTDDHAVQLTARASALDQQAAHSPQPVGERLRAAAARIRSLAQEHHRTRFTLQEEGAADGPRS